MPLPQSMQVSPERRTTVQVQLYQDPWPLIQGWATHNKWKVVGTTPEGVFVCTKGWGSPPPQNVAFFVEGPMLTIQAWITFSFFMRMRSMFILPAEVNVTSGLRGAIGRRQVRNALNELLGPLGAPPIQ